MTPLEEIMAELGYTGLEEVKSLAERAAEQPHQRTIKARDRKLGCAAAARPYQYAAELVYALAVEVERLRAEGAPKP